MYLFLNIVVFHNLKSIYTFDTCTLNLVLVIIFNHVFVCRKRLMNSPLFFRKVLRTQIEPDFQNLETFQKSQIQNKVSN